MTPRELEALIRTISNKMRADDNTKLVTKYIEHLSWLLFLKVHEAAEDEQELLDPDFRRTIDGDFRWSRWTQADMRAEDLIEFVNEQLFPHLRGLNTDRRGRLIADLFLGVRTVMKSGFTLKEVIAEVDKIDFHAPHDVHTFSVVYESLLARLGRDAGWSGEFYTPRPIVRFMVQVANPTIGQRIYDPASGSAGFLAEAFEHLRAGERTLADFDLLRTRTFFGKESGELPFLLGTMNLILHGVTVPNITRANTLEQDVRGIPPVQQFEVILTNPPFGGRENPQIQQNFPSRAAATEVLFLQHIIAFLKDHGRAAVVVPDGILFREDAAFTYVRQRLVDDFDLTAVVRLPLGAFAYAPDTRTNLLFFTKTGRTTTIRYYQVRPPAGKRSFTKTRPITDEHLAGALAWIVDGVPDENSWEVDAATIREGSYDLDVPPPDQAQRPDAASVAADLRNVTQQIESFHGALAPLIEAAAAPDAYRLTRTVRLGDFIEERGARATEGAGLGLLGVSNAGGFVPFKGDSSTTLARYKVIEPGDFAYNPMRVNVGSIALATTDTPRSLVSPEYVVFRLKVDAPFSSQYVLAFLHSAAGLRGIARNAQGTIRSRLYFDNLAEITVPVPEASENWATVLNSLAQLDALVRELPGVASAALGAFVDSLYWWDGAAEGDAGDLVDPTEAVAGP